MVTLKKIIRIGKGKLRNLRLDYWNSFGWTTDRRLIVIESDDWGGIRVPSKETYNKMIRNGDRMGEDPFTRYDALESEDDLTLLYTVLSKHKDINGNTPVITANCAMANPDFHKIRESNFGSYYYESCQETFKRYPCHARSLELWKEGKEKGLFYPQLHCREHLHVRRWMDDLQAGSADVRLAFEHEMISGANVFSSENPFAYMDAFNYRNKGSDETIKAIITDAFAIFEATLGFRPESFVACCYVWPDSLESAAKQNGVDFIQGGWHRLIPSDTRYSDYKKMRHSQGERNAAGQIYLVRNCSFEPSFCNQTDVVSSCLHQINSAFQKKKPAVICSHRLNYIGYIVERNRDKNLNLLNELLVRVLKTWPDAEFITSVQLGRLMT